MCGIAGIVSLTEHQVSPDAILKMTAALAHRGPDADGHFHGAGVQLGHRRLSILDVSSRGNQPMTDHSGRYVLIHNGEIYNFKEVRQELDYPFKTETDTELILAAYAKWGTACLDRFAGMFAFALWDTQEQRLFLARDRMGIKPLYWHFKDGCLVFASEIRAILQSGLVRARLNHAALPSYFCYQTSYGDSTLVEGVQLLPPGNFAVWEKGSVKVECWWDVWNRTSDEASGLEPAGIRGRCRELLQQSITRRLLADVPLGAFLSGGIDSSAVVALMAERSEQAVDTFSVGFKEKEYDESVWSDLIAKKYNTRHHPILLSASDFLQSLPDALAAMDHPSGDGINSYVVSKVTRARGVKVALSGLGGDELFAGYPVFTQLPALMTKTILRFPPSLRLTVAKIMKMLPAGRKGEKIMALLSIAQPSLEEIYKVFRTIYDWDYFVANHGDAEKAHPLLKILNHESLSRKKLPLLSQISGLEMLSYTHSVLLRDTDQMSMAHALEVRVPFFDHDLVSFVMGVPDKEKWPSYPKKLLVESLGDLLPPELVHRKKMGFVFPWENWIRGELSSFCSDRIEGLEQRRILRKPGQLRTIWREFQKDSGPWLWTHVWLPVVLEEWMRKNGLEG